MLKILSVLLMALFLFAGCSETRVETRIEDDVETSTTTHNGYEIERLTKEWETELIEADGEAPVIDKYNDIQRDKELARRGAILAAQANLARKISAIQITETVTMRDLETSIQTQSYLNSEIQNCKVISEIYDYEKRMWFVTVQMEKKKLVHVLRINRG